MWSYLIMLSFPNFYTSTTRKYVALFGALFDDIYVVRKSTTGEELQQFKVPITYSPKQKWYALLEKHPADTPAIKIQLPRIGFEITGMTRDDSRKNNAVHKLINITDDKGKVYTQFFPVPYKLSFELYVMSVNTDDVMQIVEQIIPFFNPDFSATMNLIPALDYKYDIRVNMNETVNKQDVYDNSFQERRVLEYSMSFDLDVWYFGPVQKSGVIKRVQVDLHSLPGDRIITYEDMNQHGRIARIVVTPGLTTDGKPTSDAEKSIPWKDIDKFDDYGFIESITEYQDGKFYNPVTGKDEEKKD